MIRTLLLAASAAALAGAAAAQPAPVPQTQPQPPVNQSPPVRTDPQDPATQDDTQSATTTSAMPSTGAATPRAPAPSSAARATTAAPATAATPATTAAAGGAATPAASGNIIATLRGTGQHAMLLQALQTAQLTGVLEDTSRTFTLFAPTDAALGALPEAQRTALMANPPALQRALLKHVFGTAVTGEQLRAARGSAQGLQMADQQRISISGEGEEVRVGNAAVTQADLRATNGVVHVVDAVITSAGLAPAAGAAAPATDPATPPAATSAQPQTPATTPGR